MNKTQNFWSRRKAAVQAEAEEEQAALEAQALAEEHAALEQKTDAEILEELDLPDPDSLKKGDDFTAFMSKAVPDRLRRRALRSLWRSNPVLANVDMLVDYGDDFTDSALSVENLQTAYQVGKGMLKHLQEAARTAETAEEETPQEAPLADAPVEEHAPLAVIDEGMTEEELAEDPDAPELTPTPRRMTFRIEETA